MSPQIVKDAKVWLESLPFADLSKSMMEREKTALITPKSTVSILEEKGTILNLEAPTEAPKIFMETIIQ